MSHDRASRTISLLAGLCVVTAAPSVFAGVTAVPTFESIGLYWSDSGGGPTVTCNVRYREHGTGAWHDGMPLWFDTRAVAAGTPVARPANEYRGSLLGLHAGTTYDIELALDGGCASQSLTVTTWSDTFPEGAVTRLPAMSSSELRITSGGTASAYAVYTGATPGATIDVAGSADQVIELDAPYVIIRGLTLRGGRLYGIELGPNAHDVVIEGNDISHWGVLSSDPTMASMGICDHATCGENGAVNCYENEPPPGTLGYPHNHDRIVVQRNRIHDPNCSAGSWWLTTDNAHHPAGTEGVRLSSCGGNHVVRYNDIVTDSAHCWNDGIGGGENFSFMGAYAYDSDIYGNRIAYACDDAIEVDGGDRNTRVWGNRADSCGTSVSWAFESVGPGYYYRNVYRPDLVGFAYPEQRVARAFVKTGTSATLGSAPAGGGRLNVMHNTAAWITSDPSDGVAMWGGAGTGNVNWGTWSRNNIVQGRRDDILYLGVYETPQIDPGAWDYDLANGRSGYFIVADTYAPGAPPWNLEAHAVFGRPQFADTSFASTFELAAGSLGVDQGEVIAGFNQDFAGAGPDIGAQESGRPPLQFGANAYLGVAWNADGSMPSPTSWPADCGASGDASSNIDASGGSDGSLRNDVGEMGSETMRSTDRNGCSCNVPGAPEHRGEVSSWWVAIVGASAALGRSAARKRHRGRSRRWRIRLIRGAGCGPNVS